MYASLLVLSVVPDLMCGQSSRTHIIEENVLSFFKKLSNINSSSPNGRTVCPLFPRCWYLLYLKLVQVLCMLPQHYEFICATTTLCIVSKTFSWDLLPPLALIIFLFLLSITWRFQELQRRCMVSMFHSGLNTLKFLFLYVDQLRVSVITAVNGKDILW